MSAPESIEIPADDHLGQEGSPNQHENVTPRLRRSPRTPKYVVGSSFKGMDGGRGKSEYKVGVNGGVYRASDKNAPKSADGAHLAGPGHHFGRKI